jgi:hypothetical protein
MEMKLAKELKKTATKTPARKNGSKPATPVSAAPALVAPKLAAPETPRIVAPKLPKSTRATPTTIEARVNVGFGNNLFIRGQGAGLSWEKGVPLQNVDAATWKWSAQADGKLTFKLLINDAVWQQGEDITAAAGQKVELTPNF